MGTKHTPPPWEIKKRIDGKVFIIWNDGDGFHRLRCEVDCDDCDSETALANALLIVAAPELLAACQVVVKAIDYGKIKDPSDPNYVNALQVVADRQIAENLVHAAIRKATTIPNQGG